MMQSGFEQVVMGILLLCVLIPTIGLYVSVWKNRKKK